VPFLVQRVRAAGLRATRPRLAVLEVLAAGGGHQSADDVHQSLVRQGHALPRTTVYNVLNDLAAARVIMQADLGPGRMMFEYAGEWHHHFVCRRCQGILDVPAASLAVSHAGVDLPGARVEAAQVILRGICPACAAGS
jgi:Fur family transcriptional regulator, stress-responsive regulator